MTKPLRIFLLALSAVALVVAMIGVLLICERRQLVDDLALRIEAVANNKNEFINLAAITSFSWDKVHVFCPYTSPDKICATLGYPWWWASSTGIQTTESFFLLVFVKSGHVRQYCMFPRIKGDFEGTTKCFTMTKHNAVFLSELEMSVYMYKGTSYRRLKVFPAGLSIQPPR